MKKIKFVFFFACFFCNFLSAQVAGNVETKMSAEVAASNRRIAQRYLNSAENYLASGSWTSALSQSEMGLSYDDSISDLLYIKALSMSNLKYKRAEVYNVIKQAFAKDEWVNYNRNGARILYADVLSEIGLYDESITVLDQKPFIYSADAELIRIKNYYRMGTADSISQARAKLNSVRKVYPNDSRFPKLFFMFEMIFMNHAELNNSESYEIPEVVKSIADDYIQILPVYNDSSRTNDYASIDYETEVMALLFAEGEQQTRLLKAVGEKESNNPLYAFAALKAGILSEEKAYNLFFEASNNMYSLNLLEAFARLIKNEGLRANLHERLNSLTGTLFIDEELDLRTELIVKYERGRPAAISYDADNDNILDLYANCDFGVPYKLAFEKTNLELLYNKYPAVKQIELKDKNMTFDFLDKDFSFVPFEMISDKIFAEFEVSFFIPYINKEIVVPDEPALAEKASTVEIKTAERENSIVKYSVYSGMPVYASFTDNNKRYAYASMEAGYPFVRYVDSDGDDYYETIETYDFAVYKGFISEESKELVNRVFGDNTFSSDMFLLSVEIDRNGNTIKEFKEEYLKNNGKTTYWDNDDDGHWDCAYIRYPDNQESSILTEEAVFYDAAGTEIVCLRTEDGKPVSIRYKENTHPVFQGEKKSLYWIEQKGDIECEELVEKDNWRGFANGVVKLIEHKDGVRLFVIRIDDSVYCKLVP